MFAELEQKSSYTNKSVKIKNPKIVIMKPEENQTTNVEEHPLIPDTLSGISTHRIMPLTSKQKINRVKVKQQKKSRKINRRK